MSYQSNSLVQNAHEARWWGVDDVQLKDSERLDTWFLKLTPGTKVRMLYFWFLMMFLEYFSSHFSGQPSQTVRAFSSFLLRHRRTRQSQQLRKQTEKLRGEIEPANIKFHQSLLGHWWKNTVVNQRKLLARQISAVQRNPVLISATVVPHWAAPHNERICLLRLHDIRRLENKLIHHFYFTAAVLSK